jgi:hypothetical protein
MSRLFIVVSGLPGSGKSTFAQLLAPALNLSLIDKDTILERLFDSKGVGDAAWRRALSRESDEILQAEALALPRAILVSFWHLPGMPPDSGTPTDWLDEIADEVLTINCMCSVEIAARRFVRRNRHPGHLDGQRSYRDLLASLEAIEQLGPLEIGQRIDIDLSDDGTLRSDALTIRCAGLYGDWLAGKADR